MVPHEGGRSVSETTSAAATTADTRPGAPDIRLRGLVKRYGATAAVDGVDLDIEHGEFFTLLGPSGSGKTTTLDRKSVV